MRLVFPMWKLVGSFVPDDEICLGGCVFHPLKARDGPFQFIWKFMGFVSRNISLIIPLMFSFPSFSFSGMSYY